MKRRCVAVCVLSRAMHWLIASTIGRSSCCSRSGRIGSSSIGPRSATSSFSFISGRSSSVRPR
jgi:hypothetical protein